MAAEIHQIYRSAVTVMASVAASADTRAAGTQTTLNNDNSLGTENGKGASGLHFELDVTVAPSTATHILLYVESSQDNTNFAAPRQVGVFEEVGTSADRYDCFVYDVPKYSKWSWTPVGYGATATLAVMPFLPESQ